MPDDRVKGQEVSIIIATDSQVEDTLTDITKFGFTYQLEVKSQGFLGEKTERKDMRYKGIKFDMEMQIHKKTLFDFAAKVVDKAKRVTPNVKFNVTGVFFFPNGDTVAMLLQDCSFGEIPVTVGGAGDYVTVKIQGECPEAVPQAA